MKTLKEYLEYKNGIFEAIDLNINNPKDIPRIRILLRYNGYPELADNTSDPKELKDAFEKVKSKIASEQQKEKVIGSKPKQSQNAGELNRPEINKEFARTAEANKNVREMQKVKKYGF